ncbi:MAG: hypothetical protein JRK53_24855 [Deltaproteobacteria bacterium]|nr:hypothetical protein [Deltaproteobacteria bacterium]
MEKNDSTKKTVLLKNGNPQGNPNLAARCGAKTRRGTPCKAPAMKNGRCRLHGGKSTGPRTPEGLERSKTARLRHGLYSEGFRKDKKDLKALSKLWEIRVKLQNDNPIMLDAFTRHLLKCKKISEKSSFLTKIDLENLSFDDQLKLHKKTVPLLNRSTKALVEFWVKFGRESLKNKRRLGTHQQ